MLGNMRNNWNDLNWLVKSKLLLKHKHPFITMFHISTNKIEKLYSISDWYRFCIGFFHSSFCDSSEEVTTSPVTTTEYWNAAPHPQLAHLPQLPHPLNNKVVTVQATTAKKLPTTQTTKIGKNSFNFYSPSIFMYTVYIIWCTCIQII